MFSWIMADSGSGAGLAQDDPESPHHIREREGIRDEWGCVKV